MTGYSCQKPNNVSAMSYDKRCQVHLIFCICFHKSGYSKSFNDSPLLRTKILNLGYMKGPIQPSPSVPSSPGVHCGVHRVVFLLSLFLVPTMASFAAPEMHQFPPQGLQIYITDILSSTSYTFFFTIFSIIHLSIWS